MRLLFSIALMAAPLASAAIAQQQSSVDLTFACNPHGAVLRVSSGPTYYLGKTCDAADADGGQGRWWFAASGFIVEINGQSVRFAQDIPCDIPYCRP